MIIGIGVDIVEISRVGKLIEKQSAINKVFTEKEHEIFATQSKKAQWAAGRFAAKEAASKALKAGISRCPMDCVEVLCDDNGAPTLEFLGVARKLLPKGEVTTHISISHDAGLATAYVVLEIAEKNVIIQDKKAAREIAKLLPMRDENSHKGDMGKLAILAGSKKFTGAGYLATLGALKGGAGLVTWCTNYKPSSSPIEAMNYVLPKINGINKFVGFCKDKDAVVIGPGLGVKYAMRVMKKVLGKINCPQVLDADALNAIAQMNDLPHLGDRIILTPHIAEGARLLKKTNEYVSKNTVECAKELSRKTGAVVVLKCHNTVICSPSMELFVNSTGNAGMATGGSGDVLSGLIAALLKRLSPIDAAKYAVYLHGLAGDTAKADIGENSLTAMDIANNIATAYKLLNQFQ